MKQSKLPLLCIFLLASLAPAPLLAQFLPGDLIASVAPAPAFQNMTQPFIKIYAQTGSLKSEIELPTNLVLYDLNFHDATLFGVISRSSLSKLSSTGLVELPIVARSFVFDARGNLYVADRASLKVYDGNFRLLRTLSLPEVAWEIDLAADQCTMYYISAPDGPVPSISPATIARYDVCTSQPLLPLPTPIPSLGSLGTLRVLPGNDLLLGTTIGIQRIRQDGSVLQTYSGGPQLAIDLDGISFWEAGNSDRVRKIDLASGREIGATVPYGPGILVFSLTVVGEPRAAIAVAIPTLSQWLLVGLAVALLMLGWIRV